MSKKIRRVVSARRAAPRVCHWLRRLDRPGVIRRQAPDETGPAGRRQADGPKLNPLANRLEKPSATKIVKEPPPSAIDVAKARAETRGTSRVTHLNNAGCSLPPDPVQDYLVDWLAEEAETGGYETAARRKAELEAFYDSAACLVGGHRDEIAFVENATRAWDMAFYALPLGEGDKILTTTSEYGSNMIGYLHRAKQTGCEVVVVPDDTDGQIDVAALADAIDDRVKLISISHIPTGMASSIRPPPSASRAGIRGALPPRRLPVRRSDPLDVAAIGCDFLSVTGRKYLRAPRGTGFLWMREAWIEKLDPPLLDQHAAELVSETRYEVLANARRFENWERYFGGQAALAVIDYALDLGMEAIRDRIYALADGLREALAAIPAVTVTDQGAERCGIVTFTRHRAAGDIKARMAELGINVSVSSGSGMRVSFDRRGLDAVVRASVHYFNTEEDGTPPSALRDL